VGGDSSVYLVNEKYRLDTIGYRIRNKNPAIHGDMNKRTVRERFRLRFRGRRLMTPAPALILGTSTRVAVAILLG
jgi:hypothetical protein